MTRTLRNTIGSVMIIAMLVTACAVTTRTSDWKDPSYQGLPRRIMIIGVARKPVIKRIFEDEFARQLKARGTDAVASYTVMPDTKQGNHAVIAARMKEQGADAVLISRLVSKKTMHTHVHGRFSVVPSMYGNLRDYYSYGSQVVYTPGYTVEDEYALMETNLYDAGNDKLIWSATSETEILGSDLDQIKSYIGIMVNAMVDRNILR